MLLLDEAHATGILGATGRGAVEQWPPSGDMDADALIRVGTLSKALGAQGGFVSGSRTLIRWLVNTARPYIFSTALAPPVASAATEAVKIVRAEPGRRRHLLQLAAMLRAETPIVSIVVGKAGEAVRLSGRLRRQGILVPAIRPPSVPEGTARLRVSLTAGHTREDVERLLAALEKEGLARSHPVCRETAS
jgi:8-amino-7-oxononanoate synthase